MIKNSAASGAKSIPSQKLADELHKPIIRKFERRKAYRSFRDKIYGADLADIQLISIYSKSFRFLLCVIDLFSKYAWAVSWKDKKCATIAMHFKLF